MEHVRITITLLRKLDACEQQRDIFRATFPRGVTLTPNASSAIVTKVVVSCLNADWLAREVLTDPACVEYRRACDAARAKYWSAVDAAQAEYRRVRDAAWSEYERVRAVALARCRRACVRAAWALLADRNNWNPGILA